MIRVADFAASARRTAAALSVLLAATMAVPPTAKAEPNRDALLAALASEAKAADAGFTDFSADRGKAFFLAVQSGGEADTASCTSCHGQDPKQAGKTRAGKEIAAMAVSVTADRYTDPAKVAKWFQRNCNTVFGRECTAPEKGDFITFMMGE